MITVTKRFQFEAAHSLKGYLGDCSRPHGHSYKLEVTVANIILDDDMVIDFKELTYIVKEYIIKQWDHQDLNTLEVFKEDRPTAENMVTAICQVLNKYLPDTIEVERIRLWETEDSYAEYIK